MPKHPHSSPHPDTQVSNTLDPPISINWLPSTISGKYQPLKPQEVSTETILSYSQHMECFYGDFLALHWIPFPKRSAYSHTTLQSQTLGKPKWKTQFFYTQM